MNEYGTIDDVAGKFNVSISTVRSWIRKGFIPRETYIKAGNTYRFKVGEIEKALTEKSNSEPETPWQEALVAAPIPLIEEGMPELNLDEDV